MIVIYDIYVCGTSIQLSCVACVYRAAYFHEWRVGRCLRVAE